MSVSIIFAIGCFFGAFLFNFNVGWGNAGAKTIRNTLAVLGGVFLIAPIAHAIRSNSSDVGQTLLVGCLPLMFIGLFLGAFAILNRESWGEDVFKTALKGATTLEVIALVLAIIGAIVSMKGGAR